MAKRNCSTAPARLRPGVFLKAAELVETGASYACWAICAAAGFGLDSFGATGVCREKDIFYDTFKPQWETDGENVGRHAFFARSDPSDTPESCRAQRVVALCFASAIAESGGL
jgi:hypothetical protein